MKFPIILIKTLLIYFKPRSQTVRLQNPFKWDQIKSGTVPHMALALISKVFSLCLPMNPSTKNPKHVKWTYLFDIGMKKTYMMKQGIRTPCTSHDLKNHFNERISGLNLNKILQVSMDCPSVKIKFHRDVQSNFELELLKLIDIGSCFLHIIHSVFKMGVESTD